MADFLPAFYSLELLNNDVHGTHQPNELLPEAFPSISILSFFFLLYFLFVFSLLQMLSRWTTVDMTYFETV
jgi:hypothetical protein